MENKTLFLLYSAALFATLTTYGSSASAQVPVTPAANTDTQRWAAVTSWKGKISIVESGSGTDEWGYNTVIKGKTTVNFEGGDSFGVGGAPPAVTYGNFERTDRRDRSCAPHPGDESIVSNVLREIKPDTGSFASGVRIHLLIDAASGYYQIAPAVVVLSTHGEYVATDCGGWIIENTADGQIEPGAGAELAHQIPLPTSGTSLAGTYSVNRDIDGLNVQYSISWNIVPAEYKDDPIPLACRVPSASTLISENQALNEAVDLVGTPFSLVYASDRQLGRAAASITAVSHAEQLAGWTLSIHHSYDSARNQLYLGSGNWRDAISLGTVDLRQDGTFIIGSEDGDVAYVFDRFGRHLRTVNTFTGANRFEFIYDVQGRLSGVKDGDGNATIVERDKAGTPKSIIGPFGQRTALTVNVGGYLATIENPAGETITLTHDDKGMLTKMADSIGNEARYTYDPNNGRLVLAEDASGGFQAVERSDTAVSYTVTRSTRAGRSAKYQTTKRAIGGEDRAITLQNGLLGNTSRSGGAEMSRAPDGSQQSVERSPDSRFGFTAPVLSKLVLTAPSGLKSMSSRLRAVTLSNPDDPFSLSTLSETITHNGQTYSTVYSTVSRTLTTTSPKGRKKTITLDVRGRPIYEQLLGLSEITRTYDAQGRTTEWTVGSGASARTTTLTYGPAGYLAKIKDPIGRVTGFAYDAAGRVMRQISPGQLLINYGYDPRGNLTSVTVPSSHTHNFAYTASNLQSSYTPPDAGDTRRDSQYIYNLDKQLVESVRPDGKKLRLDYDSGGRLSSITLERGTYKYSYNSVSGHLASIASPAGINWFVSYDGSMPISETWEGPIRGTVSTSYNNGFRVKEVGVSGGNDVTMTYDEDGLLIGVGNMSVKHDERNALLRSTILGKISDEWNYNDFGEVTAYNATVGPTTLFRTTHERDKIGRISALTEAIDGSITTYKYEYDLEGQLVKVEKNGVTAEAFTYNGNGNRVTRTTLNGIVGASYDVQDRLTQYGDYAYTYTANGELKTRVLGGLKSTYEYDELGNLVGAKLSDGTEVEYFVDGRNRRVGKLVGGALTSGFLYQGGLRIMAELDGSGSIVSQFVYYNSGNVPAYMIKGGAVFRLLTDHLGSVRLVVNVSTGDVMQRMDYDSFGNLQKDTNPGFQPFGFAGGLYDRDTKFLRFGARDYDPETGRWTIKDPMLFSGGDSNLYSYVANDPVNSIDPLGLSWRTKARAIMVALELLLSKGQSRKAGGEMIKRELAEERIRQLRNLNKNRKRTPGGGPDPDPDLMCVFPIGIGDFLDRLSDAWERLADVNEDGQIDDADAEEWLNPGPIPMPVLRQIFRESMPGYIPGPGIT